MKTAEDLRKSLQAMDGRSYNSYQSIKGVYAFPSFTLYLDYIQKDPFAPPSRLRVRIPQNIAGIPPRLYHNRPRRIGAEDFLTRNLGDYLLKKSVLHRNGTGNSGLLQAQQCGQEILERTALLINDQFVEARLSVGMPARGRTIMGRFAAEMLCQWLPEAVGQSLFAANIDLAAMERHVNVNEDQELLRELLKERGLAAFVANGSVLPRESGISDKPLAKEKAVIFQSPPSLCVELELPHRGKIQGMGIPHGITLIVGGGYHGKSTLLRALERGVYNHIPGDGREYAVTVKDAVKIRAEDGRRICKVDISPFISNLPGGEPTSSFSTAEASGSTSQAANIIEAMEIGTSLLLLDEDTSATNFMIRDKRMQKLVAKEKEPITPFLDRVETIYRNFGISTIIVMGGSGDYFDVSDTVIMMDEYRPQDVTQRARAITRELPQEREREGKEISGAFAPRIPMKKGLEPFKGKRIKVSAKGLHTIQYGGQELSLFYVEQLVDQGQTRALADLLYYIARKYVNEHFALKKVIDLAFSDIEEKGLDIISPFYGEHPGDYSLPKPQETAAAINRLRSLNII